MLREESVFVNTRVHHLHAHDLNWSKVVSKRELRSQVVPRLDLKFQIHEFLSFWVKNGVKIKILRCHVWYVKRLREVGYNTIRSLTMNGLIERGN